MPCRKIIAIIVALAFSPYCYPVTSANDYLVSGRASLFSGTISGMRQSYDIFDQAMSDASCIDCADNRELLFFHALSRIGMWVVRENGEPVDSGMELAKNYGFQILGDFIREIQIIEPVVPTNRYDSYEIPKGIESELFKLIRFADTTAIPDIDSIVAELDRIQESPDSRFRVYLSPSETQIFLDASVPPLSYAIEVDYAEVMLLKGMLLSAKAFIKIKSAYDLNIDEQDKLLEKLYGNCFVVNQDLLQPHPDILKVLPTANDPNDGKAILGQVRTDWISGLQYAIDALNYILAEDNPGGTDPQDNELLAIDPNNLTVVRKIISNAESIIASLTGDTAVAMNYETIRTYRLYSPEAGNMGQLMLHFNYTEQANSNGMIYFASGVIDSSEWEVKDVSIEQGHLFVQVENMANGFISGYLWGKINEDRTMITDAALDYWGDYTGTIGTITGSLLSLDREEYIGNLNPIFGSSANYPDPVSPRDILPDMDIRNSPLPGTVGKGLGFDPTLGGIAPTMTHEKWNIIGNLQPSGNRIWQEVENWQKLNDWVGFWLPDQLIFEDMRGDVQEDLADIPGTDISGLYMGYDMEYAHGCISLYDMAISGIHCYELSLSYSPTEPSELDTLRIQICLQDGQLDNAHLLHRVSDNNYSYWVDLGSFEVDIDYDLIFFRMPLYMIPTYLPGRYVSLESSWGANAWDMEVAERNETHIQMNFTQDSNQLIGTVNYDGYIGAPIYVQAYSDPTDPDNSLIASTMILYPGSFVLEGAGLGWNGYIRAFTCLFGFNILDTDAMTIQASKHVSQYQSIVSGINLVLDMPGVLQKNVWKSGSINTTTNLEDVFAFDAIRGGTYLIELSPQTAFWAKMSLAGRNGTEELAESLGDSNQTITWLCPVDGRYYIKVSEYDWDLVGGAYQIRMTSNVTCPSADISGAEWEGVRDCRIDMSDLGLLASYWLDMCSKPYWCEDCDYDKDRKVNMADLLRLLDEWLEQGEIAI